MKKYDLRPLMQEKTVGGALKALAQATLPETDTERIYIEWMIRNTSDLKGAVARLGIVVEEGPDFASRLKAAVLPRLLEGNK